ncbi:MAG: polysaccharide pyruvyl transferase family protein [Xanthobacteraceae bacterium]
MIIAPSDGSSTNIEFVNNEPDVPNIGDALCSPRHYFKFEVRTSVGKIAIVGGGAFSDFALARSKKIDADVRILWGVGRSLKDGKPVASLDQEELHKVYSLCSTRDPEWAVAAIRLVPCPSAFHPVCDISSGNQVGLFLNANPKTSGRYVAEILRRYSARDSDLVIATNSMPLNDFIGAFSKTRRLITNSYHVAYWGLLSGRSVTVIGYSSKFLSLMTLFQQSQEAVIPYRKGADEQLAEAIEQALRASPRLLLSDADAQKRKFRELNRHFAEELVRGGFFKSVRLREVSL